ncbi:chorismate synthase [Desulfallas thermosapovorans]|uniref:Chorismate synthase n=1 Tax=Desulfallas thermosapovorans DSM 6562 TaxID=1121431 RepID=A0A5S4ZQC0_9FIRM|nr:chorismate synthase [Desulfallas thermosapovorans]TYO95068.1 chorismate synthase [Desulfallas thermosapovorans DSM 6562]
MLRCLTAGESHGPSLTAILDGVPAGLPLAAEYIDQQLARRQGGHGRGGRMNIERDRVAITSGVRGGLTTGSPLTLVVANKDWPNWCRVMDPGAGADLKSRAVTRPRPGHADLTGAIKYGHRDMRNVLERSSARETAARVAAGTVARRLLEELDILVAGQVVQIGSIKARALDLTLDTEKLAAAVANSPVYCADPEAGAAMVQEIDAARAAGDSLGGVFEVYVFGLPPGLGSYTQRDRTLDGRLAGALMSIQAIKGVEVGAGFAAAAARGSEIHDEIFYRSDRGFYRSTNNAGGIEGGMSNGDILLLRAAMKPIPTLYKPLRSVDIHTKQPFEASVERSDTCAVPAACVVGEAVTAWELAAVVLEKFGGDTMGEIKERVALYRDYAKSF